MTQGGDVEVTATVRGRDTLKIAAVVAALLGGGAAGLRWIDPHVAEYVTQAQATEIAHKATISALAQQKESLTTEIERIVRQAMADAISAHDRGGHNELTPPQYREVLGAVKESEERTRDRIRELLDEMRGKHRTSAKPSVAAREPEVKAIP